MSYKINEKQYEKEKFKTSNYLPIDEICDIKVKVKINFDGCVKKEYREPLFGDDPDVMVIKYKQEQHIFLTIESKNCIYYDGRFEEDCYELYRQDIFKINEYRILTYDEYEIIQKNTSNILDKINFNKFTGRFFICNEEDEKKSELYRINCCGNNPRIKKDYGECCVCYENTLTKVYCCKGFICFKCWSNIKPKNKGISCPLCRNLINSEDTIEDDDE